MGNEAHRNGGPPARVVVIGAGGMARHHVRQMLQQPESATIGLICEPSDQAYGQMAQAFVEIGLPPPPRADDLDQALLRYGANLDAALICTPHAFHHDHAAACLEAGLDVLLEKPMVMTVSEAESLIAARNRTDRLLVVAFNGSLSPQIRKAAALLHSGQLGTVLNIHAVVWQGWREHTVNTWRQAPEVAGGGFLFDTGAHLLKTVADLAGEEFVEVSAWLNHRGAPVDITGSVMARLASGALVTLSGCGETIPSCASDVRVFCTGGILRTGVWGERLQLQRAGQHRLMPVRVPASRGPWEQFVRVRNGEVPNPSPPEIGLRMARLWDAVRASAAQGGAPVQTRALAYV